MLQAGRLRVNFQMMSLDFSALSNPSNLTMVLGLTEPLTEISIRKSFWVVKRGRRIRLATSPLSVSRLARKCQILNASQTYGLATGIFLILLFYG
jgi:hypothetical protein